MWLALRRCIRSSLVWAAGLSRALRCIACCAALSCSPGKARISSTSTRKSLPRNCITFARCGARVRPPKIFCAASAKPPKKPPYREKLVQQRTTTMDATQKLHFYQKGTFTVGNRLVSEEQRSVQASTDRSNALTCGHRACQGCGEALGARYAMDAAMRAKGRREVRALAQGGDGGTTDIGFGCLSGMFERNDDVLYICYDNEAYMHPRVQRSSATPPAARTATTPAMGPQPGNVSGTGKNVPKIAVAHGIPYVATATVADLHDLERKVVKAMGFHGARYLHIHVPRPLGWGPAANDASRLARLAVECGLFPVFEAEHGIVTGSRKIRRRVPVEDYLKPQRRFPHLFAT